MNIAAIVTGAGWMLAHSIWQGAVAYVLAYAGTAALQRMPAAVRYNLLVAIFGAWGLAMAVTFALNIPSPGAGPSNLAPVATTAAQATKSWVEMYAPTMVAVWLAGVGVLGFRLASGLFKLDQVGRAFISEYQPSLDAQIEVWARAMGIRRAVHLRVSQRYDSPFTFGALRAVIVLPTAALLQLSPGQIESLIVHELAHIRRHDYIVNIFQMVLETALFFHPAAWFISSQIRAERELCCDDWVIKSLSDRTTYASALAALEDIRGQRLQLALSAKGDTLLYRIQHILGKPQTSSAGFRGASLAMAAVSLTGLAALPTFHSQVHSTIEVTNKQHKLVFKNKASIPSSIAELKPSDTFMLDGKSVQVKSLKPSQRKAVAEVLGDARGSLPQQRHIQVFTSNGSGMPGEMKDFNFEMPNIDIQLPKEGFAYGMSDKDRAEAKKAMEEAMREMKKESKRWKEWSNSDKNLKEQEHAFKLKIEDDNGKMLSPEDMKQMDKDMAEAQKDMEKAREEMKRQGLSPDMLPKILQLAPGELELQIPGGPGTPGKNVRKKILRLTPGMMAPKFNQNFNFSMDSDDKENDAVLEQFNKEVEAVASAAAAGKSVDTTKLKEAAKKLSSSSKKRAFKFMVPPTPPMGMEGHGKKVKVEVKTTVNDKGQTETKVTKSGDDGDGDN